MSPYGREHTVSMSSSGTRIDRASGKNSPVFKEMGKAIARRRAKSVRKVDTILALCGDTDTTRRALSTNADGLAPAGQGDDGGQVRNRARGGCHNKADATIKRGVGGG